MKVGSAFRFSLLLGVGLCSANLYATAWNWTGAGGDLNWFTAANWNTASDGSGNAATELASGDSFTFDAVTPSGDVNYNPSSDDFAIGTITFGAGLTGRVIIEGGKIASLGNAVNNNATYSMEFANEVQFASTINLTVPTKGIRMSGGATGTVPANHKTFWGNYNITASDWTITENVTLGSQSRLVCNNLKNSGASTGVCAQESAEFIVNGDYTIQHDANSGNYNVVDNGHKGLLWVKGWILPTVNNSKKTFRLSPNADSLFTGRIKAGGIDVQLKKSGSKAYFNPAPDSPCYLALGPNGLTRYGNSVDLYFKNDFIIRCYDDWSLGGKILGEHTIGTAIYNNNIVFDTSDCDDPSVGHVVTVNNIITGNRQIAATGCGKIIWRVANNYDRDIIFTGGFVASNGVSVVLVSNKAPGNGPVTMYGGTTLAITNSVTTDAIGGNGAVTLKSGSTLAFNFSSTSTAPVLAFNSSSSLSLPTDGEEPVKVHVTANEGLKFPSGKTYTLTSGGKFPADAVSSGKVVLDECTIRRGKLAVQGGNLVIDILMPGLMILVQ